MTMLVKQPLASPGSTKDTPCLEVILKRVQFQYSSIWNDILYRLHQYFTVMFLVTRGAARTAGSRPSRTRTRRMASREEVCTLCLGAAGSAIF